MKVNELEQNILRSIALTGDVRMKELKDNSHLQGHSYTDIYNSVKELVNKNLLSKELISLGGRWNFHVFELTKEGIEMATSLTNSTPVVSQKEKIINEHGRLDIGYLFYDCAAKLNEKGYLLTQSKDGYSLTVNEKTYPILLDTSTLGNKIYTREDYLQLFDEMYEKSTTLFYLSSNFPTSQFLILDQIEAWIKTRFSNQHEEIKLQIFTSFLGRILEGEGDHWDSLHDLEINSVLRWRKKPSI